MSMENGLKVGACLLAIVLFGALPMQGAFAEEAGSGVADKSKASPPSTESNSSQPASGEDATSGTGGKNSNPIDTRLGVQPHRPAAKPGKVGDAKTKFELPAVRNPHRRTFLASRPANRTVRNAVGAPVAPQHESAERLGGEHVVSPVLPHNPAAATTIAIGSAAGLAKNAAPLEHPTNLQPNANQIGGLAALNRATIGATSVSHRGVGPSSLGGPAKTVAGINGSTVRSPH